VPTITLPADQQRFLDWLLDPREPHGVPAEQFKGDRKWLAGAIGVDGGTLSKWEKDPRFRRAWDEQILETSGGPERLQNLLDQLYVIAAGKDETARAADRIAAIRLHLEITERHTPRTTVRVQDPAILQRDDRDLLERADAMNDRIRRARQEALIDGNTLRVTDGAR
jgi:hypothetical protein